MTEDEAYKIIDAAAARLSEHFGSVQIVTSRLLPNGSTAATMSGYGDWFARRALCQTFVERDQADTLARTIVKTDRPPEGEEWKPR